MTPRNPARHHMVGVSNYRTDALYARIARAVEILLSRGKVAAPVDVLVEMGLLDREQLHQWRLRSRPVP